MRAAALTIGNGYSDKARDLLRRGVASALILHIHWDRYSSQSTPHKRHGLDCTDCRAKSRCYRYEPDIEKARVLLPPTLDQFMAVCLIAANLENVLQLLVRERMQVWPYLVVLVVAFILFQPLCNRIVSMHRDA
jgi:hypothetical protein